MTEEILRPEKHASVRLGTFVLLVILVAIAFGGAGYLFGKKGSTKTIATATATATSTVSSIASTSIASSATSTALATNTTVPGTEDWQTYTSTSYNYSLKYPKTWVYDSLSAGTTTFRITAGDQWQFGVEVAATNDTLQQNADTEKASKTKAGYSVKTSNITVGGQPAVQLTLGGSDGVYGDTETLVVYGSKLYTISEGVGSDQNESKMLQTFQFTK